MNRQTSRAGEIHQPEIKDYAIIGDCRTAALISREGSLDWLCLPNFSSPSAFARLLDPAAGHFSIKPHSSFVVERHYVHATAVLETTFATDSGIVRLIDLCPISDSVGSLSPMREILRIVEGVAGSVDLDIEFAPRPHYGRARPPIRKLTDAVWRCGCADELLLLNSNVDLLYDGAMLKAAFRTTVGERQYFSISYVERDVGTIAPVGPDADARCDDTIAWWRDWSRACNFQGRERDAVLRSAIMLKLMTFCLSGAIIAAPTTSVPEAIGGERNWDYRYCWLRDAGLTMSSLVDLGFHEEASAYLGWLLHATRLTRPNLNSLYDVYGRSNLREWTVDWLAGYLNTAPVRVGNDAITQLQLDVHGQVIAAAHIFAASGSELSPLEARMLVGFGDVICKRWREPDNGMWEIPGSRRPYTFSKAMCWVALDRLMSLHDRGAIDIGSRENRFRRTRAEIAECIEARGFSTELNSYTAELGGAEIDAAMLLLICFGYTRASDSRMVSTYNLLEKELGCDGLLYRYRPGYDGLSSREGAFGIVSFFAVVHLAERDFVQEAVQRFDRLCGFANDVGLFGEEIEPRSGRALGNYPQAFTHVGLIYSALAIERARRRAGQ
ncbi:MULTISPECIES: glycoside hydrolase family 15 protein [unclassified Bradyrhizobium]|uniref:glycoside hydrolase family 15 protein n=1 Tax=unclassified Bradyrhizobium TaxID=2631580 RepID=UPI00247A223A|nr:MULTISPECIES: glycoside hydrolase family 15 protein [unclassified Bradyrhizobium]WGR70557.1 glycoside hydrolase family 15 protein [Bradyrhizobium sp. ISRA426]WGR75394.1 glycoside hydrolase family 15 protein [Bradyrhizobium sp. ISRA430]WGR85798.1 glycoside hydrolase family 15 protein [Bradyrhizobium sp. ISRA432]